MIQAAAHTGCVRVANLLTPNPSLGHPLSGENRLTPAGQKESTYSQGTTLMNNFLFGQKIIKIQL